jgi:hypothetical protein
VEFPDFWESILSLSDISGSGGDPIAGEQEGNAAPLERGRGRNSPPASPKRVTSKACKRWDKVLDFILLKTQYEIKMLHEFL